MEIKTKKVKVSMEVEIHYTSEKALKTALTHINNTHDPYLCYSSVISEGKWFNSDFKDEYSICQNKGFTVEAFIP